ncbi:MAG: hypothetical protein ABI273_03540 [Lacunisphaera sp.]
MSETEVSSEDVAAKAGEDAKASKPVMLRRSIGDNGDILGIGWLHGSFHVAVFRRQKMVGNWSAPEKIKTLPDLGPALDQALVELKFGGTEAFLLLENEQFAHQIEATPPFSDAAARSFLQARVQRYEKENHPVLWVSQPVAGIKKERSFILHMLPRSFYESVNRYFLERRLDLTRILPLVVPVQRELDRFPIAKGRPVLVAVEAGGATVVMVAKVGEQLLFARNILADWSADPARIGVEINRSLLYANQQFSLTVDRVWLLGENNRSTAEVNAKCGTGRQITVLPTTPVEWLQSVAKLPPRQPVNLVAGHLRRKSQQRSLRRMLLAASWAGLLFFIADAWSRTVSWRQEKRQYSELSANEAKMNAEKERLAERNDAVQRERAFVQKVDDERLPAVPGKFAAIVAGALPDQMRLTDLSVKWDESSGWTFRLEGSVEADEETAREIVAGVQRQLAASPLKIRSNDSGRAVMAIARAANSTAPEMQRFSFEGGILEN